MAMANWAMDAALGERCVPPSPSRLKKLPQANTPVANSTRKGTRRSKKLSGVASNNSAPTTPPTRLITAKALKLRPSAPETWLRPAMPVAIWPGNRATVDVMLAALAPMPNNSNAGNVMNEPPPARAFWAPATTAATIRST